MRTKIVYALVSTGADRYLEQAFISMSSVKHHSKDAQIILVVDKPTDETLSGLRAREAAVADRKVVVDLDPSLPAQKRSRLLKTSLREHVEGDFLYIDTDTIIVKPLDSIDAFDFPLAGVHDSHVQFSHSPYRKMAQSHAQMIGSDISGVVEYFNGGVILSKDCELSHSFYKTWNKYYLEGYERGVRMDQPSYCRTNIELGCPVQMLPDVWNCQLKHGARYLKDAVVVHYLVTSRNAKSEPPFLLNDMSVLDGIAATGVLPDHVKELFDDPFKGLSSRTVLLSGDMLDLVQSDAFKQLQAQFESGSIRFRLRDRVAAFIAKVKRHL